MNDQQPIPWTTQEILDATGGDLLCGNRGHSFLDATGGDLLCGNRGHSFDGVSIDSRNLSPKDFFFAIIGESHDGHGFASAAVEQGVGGLVINRQMAEKLPVAAWRAKDVACIAVADTTRALGDSGRPGSLQPPACKRFSGGHYGVKRENHYPEINRRSCGPTVQHAGNRRKF